MKTLEEAREARVVKWLKEARAHTTPLIDELKKLEAIQMQLRENGDHRAEHMPENIEQMIEISHKLERKIVAMIKNMSSEKKDEGD